MALELNPKEFADKLNHCLDEVEAPKLEKKRVEILVKMLNISKLEAQNLLAGRILPNNEVIDKISAEFEVEQDWLRGRKPTPHSPSR